MLNFLLRFFSKYWVQILIVISIILLLVFVYNRGANNKDLEWQSKWDKEQARITQLNLEHEKSIRMLERSWVDKFQTIESESKEREQQIFNDLTAASISSNSLREQFGRASKQLRACTNSSTAKISDPTDKADDLQTVVFGRIDERAGDLAEYADRLELALNSCNKAYNSVK